MFPQAKFWQVATGCMIGGIAFTVVLMIICVCVPCFSAWFVAPSESVGGDAAVTTGADAPPGYSEVLKEQPPVLVYQGAFVQPVQYMVRVYG